MAEGKTVIFRRRSLKSDFSNSGWSVWQSDGGRVLCGIHAAKALKLPSGQFSPWEMETAVRKIAVSNYACEK